MILSNGKYLQAGCCSAQTAGFKAKNTSVLSTNTTNYNDEQGFTLLPSGQLLMVDAWQNPVEFGQINFVINNSCLDPTCVRGDAYLAARQGSSAAAEFQKILDRNGMVWNCWTGALAHLGLARAHALLLRMSQGADADAARAKALTAYKDFLALWKVGGPDVPILEQAKGRVREAAVVN